LTLDQHSCLTHLLVISILEKLSMLLLHICSKIQIYISRFYMGPVQSGSRRVQVTRPRVYAMQTGFNRPNPHLTRRIWVAGLGPVEAGVGWFNFACKCNTALKVTSIAG
jgi:hypothetical protein